MAADFVPLTADTFVPHVGASFQVEGGRHVLSLSEIERFRAEPGHERADFEPFVLIFSGPPGDVLAEGMQTLKHENGAVYDLYLIPIHTPEPGRQNYQALFN
ncbi:MAG: hypothetical protein J7521_06525 [Caulobacter sp.]|nr:hypothetical protein [Caulobacter sp.]